mmetsp:Transcript_7116/g.20109  ORF Transcript_7116/g.20109 Transcript_7116/m.20109 type:complete len:87 (+) Transcript_7116:838-1098(+)
MSPLQFVQCQSAPSDGGNFAIRAMASLSHSPASVPQSGQNFHDSGMASSHPPQTPAGGGFGVPAAKPHSTQNLKLGGQISPQWQSH